MSKLAKLLWYVGKLARQRPDQVHRGIDKAARMADRTSGGRYQRQIDRGTHTAKRYVEKLGKRGGGRHW